MKRLIQIITTIFYGIVIQVFIYSCSAPADSWSCSRLHSEIESCEKQIGYAKYNRSQSVTSDAEYRETVKAFEDAIAYYKKRLKTCKEVTTVSSPKAVKISVDKSNLIESQKSDLSAKINIEGEWHITPSSGYTIIEKIIIKRIDDTHYSCVLALIDNSRKTENLVLNSDGEYHTNNRHGEYYKLLGESLGSFDKQGLIETYYKSN